MVAEFQLFRRARDGYGVSSVGDKHQRWLHHTLDEEGGLERFDVITSIFNAA